MGIKCPKVYLNKTAILFYTNGRSKRLKPYNSYKTSAVSFTSLLAKYRLAPCYPQSSSRDKLSNDRVKAAQWRPHLATNARALTTGCEG